MDQVTQNSSISFVEFSEVTTMVVKGQNEAAEDILEHRDLILSHPETSALVDLFFETTSKSASFLSNLESKLRNICHQNSQNMLALRSSDENKRLEVIGKLAAHPENFFETVLEGLMKLIESYRGLRKDLEEQHKAILAQQQTRKEEKDKLEKQHHQFLVDQNNNTADDKKPAVQKLIRKFWGTIVFTVQAAIELSRGFLTGDVVGLADLVSRRRRGEEPDLSSALKFLNMSLRQGDDLEKVINSVKSKAHVVQAFRDIRLSVDSINDQMKLLGKSAGGALAWKKENDEGLYNDAVELIKKDAAKIGEEMEQLETDIKDCRKNITKARKAILHTVIEWNG